MKRIEVTLRWRITLLTICVMSVCSIALVLFTNLNTSYVMPRATDSMLKIATIPLDGSYTTMATLTPAETLTLTPASTAPSFDVAPVEIAVRSVMTTAAKEMYMGSIIILIVIVLLGGICAYYVAGNALKPIKTLNGRMKTVNVNNLTGDFDFVGPKDEIRELAMSFEVMLSKLDNAFASQKRFNASIAHELKNPLAVIKANIEVLMDQNSPSVEEYEETVGIVKQSVDKMNASIEALLDLVQEENAALNDIINLDELMEDVIADLRANADKQNIEISLCVDKIQALTGNEVLIYRALYNLVENAIKYTPEGGRVSVVGTCDDEVAKIVIKDTGRGISEDEIEAIFTPFYRGKQSKSQEGLGLGLSMTKASVSMHGGTISVKSIKDVGTEFTVKIPLG